MRAEMTGTPGSRLRSFASITGRNWLTGRHLTPLIERIGRTQTGVVLDLGCGESPFRTYFPHAAYLRLDRSPGNQVDVAARLPAIPVRDCTVDCALLLHVLADLPEPRELLAEVRRVLKPGGTLFILETLCYPPHDLPDDYFRILPAGLDHLAAQIGLRVVEVHWLGSLFTRFASLCNTYVIGAVGEHGPLRLVTSLGIAAANAAFWCADRLVSRPCLAESYAAVLIPE